MDEEDVSKESRIIRLLAIPHQFRKKQVLI
jgi:hypothetical protein